MELVIKSAALALVALVLAVFLHRYSPQMALLTALCACMPVSYTHLRRIGKPEEVLTIGETVNAKITDIDSEKKKISLSIRALLDASNTEPEEVEAEENDAE